MQITDTPGRALALLDRAVLLRLDPDPEVAVPFDHATDEPLTAGPNGANPEVYLSIMVDLCQANSTLDLLGWGSGCSGHDAACPIPHAAFAHHQSALFWIDDCADDCRYDDLVVMIDKLLDSAEFGAVHQALAGIVLRGAIEPCPSIARPKR
ncbi:hypothetical protein [Microbacterium capsulatum]|uniref:Uncharacterized protein n=1 Tax=Microbacterium capsulatum TaxID=3041921 RepID=A0ABU0XFZ7_9MICO|nr:hypothetical protein [Microbacterium sp. ASV81]MDQ4214046.1 hypothetical protein [Microbacterium sp. ASV81]